MTKAEIIAEISNKTGLEKVDVQETVEAFFKVVICLNGKPKGIGFIRKNTDTTKRNDLYVNTICEVERITGITFFPTLSKMISEEIKSKADLKDWD